MDIAKVVALMTGMLAFPLFGCANNPHRIAQAVQPMATVQECRTAWAQSPAVSGVVDGRCQADVSVSDGYCFIQSVCPDGKGNNVINNGTMMPSYAATLRNIAGNLRQ